LIGTADFTLKGGLYSKLEKRLLAFKDVLHQPSSIIVIKQKKKGGKRHKRLSLVPLCFFFHPFRFMLQR